MAPGLIKVIYGRVNFFYTPEMPLPLLSPAFFITQKSDWPLHKKLKYGAYIRYRLTFPETGVQRLLNKKIIC